jgi:probable rRNA maturation factor
MTDGLNIEISCACPTSDVDISKLEEIAALVCEKFNVCQATVSIAIVNDEEMIRVHKEFLDSDTQTDVISFDLTDEESQLKSFELVVNYDEAGRQSSSMGHSIQAELALYITHGLLHNLGFDDIEEDQSEKMHDMEDEILTQAGYGSVYKK